MVAITEMTNWAVDLIDVYKTYGRQVHALRGVNIQVGRGEIFGLLGPNGAGKSTLVKIMMTVTRPTRALGTILGRPLGHRGKLARMGYLPESHRFPGYLTGYQLLDLYGALAKVPRRQRRLNAERLLERVGMKDWAKTRIDKYSKGMMQRLGIAQSLLNNPELVVLDEPTDGLDPVGRKDTRELLLELRRQGTTVFLNSHLLGELERVCDRVAILIDGMVARQGTLRELTEHTTEYHVTFEEDPAAIRARIEATGGRLDGRMVIISGHDLQRVNQIIDLGRSSGLTVSAVSPQRFSLEDLLVEAMGQSPHPPTIAPTARPVGR